MIIIAIALGGALGALARYGLAGWIHEHYGAAFPWGTLVVNVIGSVFLGVVIRLLDGATDPSAMRAFLTVGLAGGFTTFSTFAFESVVLLQEGQPARAAFYIGASVLLGILGVLLGFTLAGPAS